MGTHRPSMAFVSSKLGQFLLAQCNHPLMRWRGVAGPRHALLPAAAAAPALLQAAAAGGIVGGVLLLLLRALLAHLCPPCFQGMADPPL